MPRFEPSRPWRGWYNLAAWRKRRQYQLALHPLCCMCMDEGRDTGATVADHVIPHRGDWESFIGGDLQSLCAEHHSAVKQREEQLAVRDARLGSAESSKPLAR